MLTPTAPFEQFVVKPHRPRAQTKFRKNTVYSGPPSEDDRHPNPPPMNQAAFLSRLAHELRNPLAPIRMALQIMQVSEDDIATVRAARVIIDRQLSQLTRLIEDLADISTLEAGAIRLQFETTPLKALLDRALMLARPQLEGRQNVVRVELPDPAPEISADIGRLGQAICNVLINASKYSEAGGAITLRATAAADELTFTIEDSGVGIPRSMLARIFEPFVQVHRNGAATHDGLGLGLAVVRNIVRAHGGAVRAESDGENRGARVVLKIPARPPADPVSPELRPSAEGLEKLRILVADDNRDAAQTLSMMLSYDGHEVRTAYDGLEVLAVGQAFNPDLVLLDIGMPVMDGYQTARQIRERPWGRRVHLAALTGWGQESDRQEAFAQGFQHHIVKPASFDKLGAVIAAVRRAVSKRDSPQ